MKSQSAIEFLTTYSFMFLVIAAVLIVIFAFASVPKKSIPFRCTSYGGFSCVDVLYTSTGNSLLRIELTDIEPGVVSISSFSAKINGAAVTTGTCTLSAVLPGNAVTCVARFPFKVTVGNLYTGVFNISANYCANGVGNISNVTCKAGSSFIYAGSFATQAQPLTLPQYVGSFDGASSSVAISSLQSISGSRSDVAWVYFATIPSGNTGWPVIVDGIGGTPHSAEIFILGGNNGGCSGRMFIDWWGGSYCSTLTLTANTWYQVAYTYDGSTVAFYVNGAGAGTVSGTLNTIAVNTITLGADKIDGSTSANSLNGQLSNVQIYNIALSANQIQNLYAEGIGGTPINTANDVGWWQLNNNANDLSGNGNNGIATSVTYNSNWMGGYTTP
jgi:hypothetical protein